MFTFFTVAFLNFQVLGMAAPDLTAAPSTIPQSCSMFLPSFLQRIADPSIRTVMLCGCGGGFDFVHSLLFYPELKRLRKQIIIGSYSFGNSNLFDAPTVYEEQDDPRTAVKKVTADCGGSKRYAPELHVYVMIRFQEALCNVYHHPQMLLVGQSVPR